MLPAGVTAQKSSARQWEGLKGPAHTVTFGWIAEKDNLRHIITVSKFDRVGQEIEETRYGKRPLEKTSTPIVKSVYAMKDGLKTERNYDVTVPSKYGTMPAIAGIVVNGKVQPLPPPPLREPDGAILRQAEVKEDATSRRVEIIWHKRFVTETPISYRLVYQLDSQGRIEEEFFYDGDSSASSRSVHKYNEQGIEIEFTEYESDGSLRSKDTYSDFKLDRRGNWIERTVTRFYVRSDNRQPVTTSDKHYRVITYYPAGK
ncbi:MAG: hypothetical protein U0Y68_15855 [Blastocatellia bacterium]